ncbi:deleted in malignant brain tumors 1 protein-like isoform X2 [Megalobrama amblycephala]|uniref:deleted in malignant brain tumors 1 protein-like isoform X2 n=1 Tax=Megalobrama amblycephala TaxID=75352 RepID=UPI0020142B02|nr:deleted in malignant brain tumors 1 protein-like isoform X2 [Megalobrama amblycephala]
MEALNFLLCLLLTAYQANTVGSWTTGDWLFTTEVSSEPCGDYLTDWMGEFSSPRYPNSYPDNARCTWTIHSTGGTTVLLTFTDVYLETCCDYIRVYDGPSTHSPLLDEIRDYKNKRYTSSNNDLTVFFYSDSSVSRRGFHANWVFVDSNSCRHNCGRSLGTCSCDDSCRDNRNCCYDYYSYCSLTTTWPATTDFPSCRYDCGYNFGSCSCAYDCHNYGNCCPDYDSYCLETTTTTETTSTFWIDTTAPSCMWNCGYNLGSCSCTHDCQYYGNCCPDYDSYCPATTTTYWIDTTAPSCKWNCGYNLESCSCDHVCQYYGGCCPDYDSYCFMTTTTQETTTQETTTEFIIADEGSCENNCGEFVSICGCDDLCQRYNDCCPDYDNYCLITTTEWPTTTDFPSCRYNCGHNLGSCSCNYNCYSYGNCCPDYDSYCSETTTTTETTSTFWIDTTAPSCMWNCGYNFGSCSCTYDCYSYGNCCPDYDSYCPETTTTTATTYWIDTTAPSCMWNCGYNFGSCSCTYDCHNYGNCCPDYDNYCFMTTEWPTTTAPSCRYSCGYDLGSCSCVHGCQYYGVCCSDYESFCIATIHPPDDPTAPSCMYNCGYHLGYCSCSRACLFFGDCCHDYENVCLRTTTPTTTTTTTKSTHTQVTADENSCENNCGQRLPLCRCDDLCQHYGNCCPDYDSYCSETTTTTATTYWIDTTAPSCIYNCGYNFGSCSCTHDCQYYGNCCPDYHWYCPSDTTWRDSTTTTWRDSTTDSHPQCGGHLYGSGLFSSPNYPSYYHDNAYCVWYLSAQQGQRIFLSFVDVQLERCCNCDYISVYDGSSTGYPLLGKICFNDTNNQVLHSSSRYLTVVFRSDYSGVSHGFKALFTSSLTANEGRVDCSSDNMVIVIQQSYLNSLGYSGNDLYVDDHLCRPTITSYEVVFSFALDMCGTAKEMMNGYVSYTNNVRASQSQSGEITRQSQFLLRVGCRMEPDTIVQIFYKAKEIINANITGTGRFNASIAFYTSSSFYQQIYDSPYEVNLNQLLYVQVKLNRPDNSLDLFLDTCVASPNPSDFKDRSYDLLRNGCPRDNTYYSYTSGQHYYAQFSFRAFKFLRTHAYVYLQCKVIICPDNDYNSRCRQGCRYRRKRSLDSTYHTNTVTLGPIKLKGGRRAFRQREKIEAAE